MRFFISHIETRFLFLFALMASLFILPQTSQANATSICPSGVQLYKLAQQNIGPDENPSIATLLWLDRGDAMWSDHPYDSDMVRKKIWGITYNYKVGSQGYPKSKKTSKRLNKYREAHRDARPRIISGSGPVLVRPKGVPAAPPASAIALAEENLKCRYFPNIDPNERAKKVAERQVCLLEDGAMADKILGPAGYHRNLKKDELAHIDKAAAVLMWKHRGSKALTEPDEDGVDRTGNRKVDIQNLAVRGYNSILYPRPDIVAAFKANRKDGSVGPLLSAPPLNMAEWAEDYLDCRYDGNSWDSAAASREAGRQEIARKKEQKRQEWIANAPQRERERQESKKRIAQQKQNLIAFAKENPNCQAEYEKIYLVMSGRPLANAQTCGYGCNPGFAKVTDAQVSFALDCEKAQREGLVSTPDNNVQRSTQNGDSAPYTLSDGLRDMGNAAACTRQEKKCVSDGQYERCKMVTVKVC